MKSFYLSLLSTFLLLSGCGGSGGGDSSDTTPPVITSSADVSVSENTTAVVTLTADDPSTPVTFAISGTDAALFTLTGANLSFIAAPNFEAPLDAGANNVYSLVVTATDAASNSATQTLTVTVTNVVDVPTIATFNTTIADGTATGTSIGTITIGDTGDTAITSITLSDGATGGSADFNVSIDGNITVVNAPVYATQSTYNLTVVATNTVGASAPVPVTITIVPGIDKVIASDFGADDNFGAAVAMSGNYVVVGAPFDDNVAPDINASGSAYVYVNDGEGNYTQVAKLNAGNAAAEDLFGTSVAIDGNFVVIGAPGKASSAGAAYVFEVGGTFNFVTEINANNAVAGDHFGYAVGISGNYVVVGADAKASGTGSAYVFENTGGGVFNQIQELTADVPSTDDYFGAAVAIDGNFIVVGALLEDPLGVANAGSAYVFYYNGTAFNQIGYLYADDAEAGDHFGYSVAINGNYVVVGAYEEDPAGVVDAGSAYVFENVAGTFSEVAKLIASDAQAGDRFGNAVGISGNYIIVGAELEDPFSVDLIGEGGSAYIFKNNTGTFNQIAKLNAPDGKAGDHFGSSVGMSGVNTVVGAKRDDLTGANFAGSAYMFHFVP